MLKIKNTRRLDNHQQIGPWRKDNLGTTQTIVAMTYGGVGSGDGTSFVVGHGGAIVGVVATVKDDSTSGGIVAGSVTVNSTVAGTVVGEDCVLTSAAVTRVKIFKNKVAFVKGAKLGVKITSASLWPVVNDYVAWLMVNWNLVGSKAAFTATS